MGELGDILLVEDDNDHAALVEITIKDHIGLHRVVRADNAAAARAYLLDRAPPRFILLDLKLPGESGHELLEHLKSDERLRSIPVVILTTSDARSDRARALHAGANSYLVKPLDFETLRAMVAEAARYWTTWNRNA